MKILIKGAGDLATGIASRLYNSGYQILMTDIAVPLTVRRTVALSRAVYEGKAEVETMTGILVKNMDEAEKVLSDRNIPVIVDEKAEIRKDYQPDVVVDAILAKGGVALITADHGNADQMYEPDGSPFTAHTTNPVPFIVAGMDCKLREGGKLADIAPTMLQILDLPKPEEMDGTSLIAE